MLEYYFLMVWNHYISLDVITLFNFRGVFILVGSSDSLAVSPGLSKTQTKTLKFEANHFAHSLLPHKSHTPDVFLPHGEGGNLGASGLGSNFTFS